MKKILFLLLVLPVLPTLATAGEGYPPALEAAESSSLGVHPSYLSPDVPLSDKEQQALEMAAKWAKSRTPAPVMADRGKMVFMHGAALPTIIASPLNICDVELEPGEVVNEVVVGDSARWMVETGSSSTGPDETVHLFIKPVDSGLESSAVVTTDRRVYHLRLISRKSGHTPYVGFLYSDQLLARAAHQKRADEKKKKWESTTDAQGRPTDLSRLNFNYTVKGKAPWKPEHVYDDGRQTFIRLPEKSASGEMPVLLVRKSGKDVLVNYRVKDRTMVVDGLFERIALVIGVGGDQEKVEVRRDR